MRKLIVSGMMAFVLTGCATSFRSAATTTAVASDIGLNAFQRAERKACDPAVEWPNPVRVCVADAAAFGLTTAKHQEIAKAEDKIFTTLANLAPVLRAWKTGDQVPKEFPQLISQIEEMRKALKGLNSTALNALFASFDVVVSNVATIANTLGGK